MNLIRARLPAIVLTGCCAAGTAQAVLVELSFRGTLTDSVAADFRPGDAFVWTLVYESSGGNCQSFIGGNIFDCEDNVVSQSARFGDVVLEGPPVKHPELRSASVIQVSNGTPVGLADLFQGSSGFGPAGSLEQPGLAFYLYDSTGTAFGTDERLPVSWSDASLKAFDRLEFRIFDWALGEYSFLARGIIDGGRPYVPPIPEPRAAWLWIMGLAGLGLRRRWRRAR